ncbi:EamA family transporter [Odoribacter sp. AF15-53]|nr:EamA family transporter [Odoribacter sp. AF15-53]
MYLTPLITLIASAIVLKEHITFIAIGGALLIICGVYVAEKGLPTRKKKV